MRLEPPFNMIIVGMTRCGKTYYLLKKLENDYKGCFEYIFLICPTYLWNKTYQEWKYKDDKKFFPIPCDQDHVELFLKYIATMFKGTNSLIILDDCAQGHAVKGRINKFVDFGFSGRHFGFSTIIITQQFKSVTKPYRDQTDIMVTFYNPNYNDMKEFLTEAKRIPTEEMDKIIDELRNNKHSKLEVLRMEGMHEIVYPD